MTSFRFICLLVILVCATITLINVRNLKSSLSDTPTIIITRFERTKIEDRIKSAALEFTTKKPTTNAPIVRQPIKTNAKAVVAEVPKKPDPLACLKYEPGTIPTIADISKVNLRKGKSIFFHETSCKSREAGKVTLNVRQACAIETAARANPSLDVYVLITAPAVIKNEGTREDKILQMLLTYPNIFINHMYLEGYVTNTPVEPLYHSGKIEKSYWVVSHLSDVLRFTTLWKYGGIYLDLDVLVIKSLENLVPNFSALQFADSIAAGVMGFDAEGVGHGIVHDCMEEVNRDFNPYIWGHNAIDILTKILKKVCKNTKVKQMTPEQCEGFKLYKESEFYPISYPEVNKFFDHNYLQEARKRIAGAYAVHLWNKLSEKKPLTFNTTKVSLIEEIAKEHCPNVYKLCGTQFQ